MAHISSVLICERVLEEKDGSLSIVRIADRFTLHDVPDPMPENETPGIVFNMLVAVKSVGEPPVDHSVSMALTFPSGKVKAIGTYERPPIKTGETGFNVIARITLELDGEGIYWFEATLDKVGQSVRVPVQIVYERQSRKQ